MRCVAGYAGQATSATVAALVKEAVHAASARAKVARLQPGQGRAGAVFQNFSGHEVVAGHRKTPNILEQNL